MTLAPIALFCYRRKDVLERTVEALKNNIESKDSMLFIFSDGYKSDEDKACVEEVREYIHKIVGFKNVEIIEAPTNKGLANSIIDGVTRIVNEYGKIIVVEDDILTSHYFLKYMNDALDMYQQDNDVACISGYVYPIQTDKQTFFVKGSNCWGWATWKRAWDIFESDGQKLLESIQNKQLEYEFDFYGSCPYVQMLQDQIKGNNNSWAVRWLASCFLKNKLCLYPGKTLVQNIGFGVEGSTHCSINTDIYDSPILSENINLTKIETKEKNEDRIKFSEFYKKLVPNDVKGNFIFKKEKNYKYRKITILGFIKFCYKK